MEAFLLVFWTSHILDSFDFEMTLYWKTCASEYSSLPGFSADFPESWKNLGKSVTNQAPFLGPVHPEASGAWPVGSRWVTQEACAWNAAHRRWPPHCSVRDSTARLQAGCWEVRPRALLQVLHAS